MTELQSTKTQLEHARGENLELQSKLATLEQALAATATHEAAPSCLVETSSPQLAATQEELQAAQTLIQQLHMRVEELV